jgi:3-phosphoshikimate 1-carboxyvinyltransferase
LSAFVCLGNGVYRLGGVPRMHERPQAALFQALRELGYRVESENGNDKLPVKIFGSRSRGDETQTKKMGIDQRLLTSSPTKKCRVSIEESSQFASALLLCAKVGNWKVEVIGENAEESPYVTMTSKLMEAFPKNGGTFQIEPDASSGSYFWAVSLFELIRNWKPRFEKLIQPPKEDIRSFIKDCRKMLNVIVVDWPNSGWQNDEAFPAWHFNTIVSRKIHLADSIMTAIIIAPFGSCPTKFIDLGRLRVQETERVVALRTELTKCGAKVIEEGDTLTVWPSPLHGAEIETYNDHRMAMCFAILGLKVPGIKIKNPACVKKTFPNFFQKLAAQPPHGLGIEIWAIKNGRRTRKLSGDDLFAD